MKYDFNVNRLEGKFQININEWLYPEQSSLEIYKISGKSHLTCITKVRAVGDNELGIKPQDIVLLSKVACDIATSPMVSYSIDGNSYFNVPTGQVVGVFEDRKITLGALKLKNNNVLFKKIEKNQESNLLIEDKDAMLGEVLGTSENSSLKKGDIIAIRDNVSTPVKFPEGTFYTVEEKFIVGKFTVNLNINSMELINGYILMKPYVSQYVLNSTILEAPSINYEDLDYSDIHNRDLFRVSFVDKSVENIQEGDVLLVCRDYTNYMYYNNEKYFVINDKKCIVGKIIERDKQCN